MVTTKAGAAGVTLAVDVRLNELCRSINNTSACGRAIERHQLATGVGGAARSGNRLLIQIADGRHIALENEKPGDPQGIDYQYIEYLQSIAFHLVHIQYYEGDEFLLISNADGGRYLIPGVPRISPDQRTIVVVSACEAFCTNGVFAFKIRDGILSPTLWYEPEEYELFSFVAWTGPESFMVKKIAEADPEQCPGSQFMTVPLVLRRDAGRWLWQQVGSKVECN